MNALNHHRLTSVLVVLSHLNKVRFAGIVLLLCLGDSKLKAQTEPELVLPVRVVTPLTEVDPMVVATTTLTGDEKQQRLLRYQRGPLGEWPQPQSFQKDGSVRLRLQLGTQTLEISLEFQLEEQSSSQANRHFVDSIISSASVNEQIATENENVDAKSNAPLLDESIRETVDHQGGDMDRQVAATRYERDDVTVKLRNFVRTTGDQAVDLEELYWMLDHYRPGPLWLLGRAPHLADFAIREPLFAAWDTNSDGKLNRDEREKVVTFLAGADRNHDDSTSLVEIERELKRYEQTFLAPRIAFDWTWILEQDNADPQRSTQHVSTTLQIQASSITNQLIHKAKTALGLDQPASTDDNAPSHQLRVSLGSSRIDRKNKASIDESNAIVRIDGAPPLWIAFHGLVDPTLPGAEQFQCSIAGTFRSGQLWTALDSDGDGNIGLIERARAEGVLSSFDTNGDDDISIEEIPLTLDVVLCQGSAAVDQLDQVRIADSKSEVPVEPAPPWFISMDQNGDGVISRDEFIGSKSQFSKLDQDDNGWIDRNETH